MGTSTHIKLLTAPHIHIFSRNIFTASIIRAVVSPHRLSSNTIHSLPVLSTNSFISHPISVRTPLIMFILSLSYLSHSNNTCSTVSSSPLSHFWHSLLAAVSQQSLSLSLKVQVVCV